MARRGRRALPCDPANLVSSFTTFYVWVRVSQVKISCAEPAPGTSLRAENVESGEFLHSEVKMVFLEQVDQIWEGNHTDLVTRPGPAEGASPEDAQRWVMGPESFRATSSSSNIHYT
jgi:hypothetical protein